MQSLYNNVLVILGVEGQRSFLPLTTTVLDWIVGYVFIIIRFTSLFTLSIHHVPIAFKCEIISSGPSTLSLCDQSFYFWCNPRLITRVSFNAPKWEGRHNNFVDSVRKKEKLIIAGLRVKQWRPINLAQLFPHCSPIGRSRISHEAGRSQVGICVRLGWVRTIEL